VTRPTAHTPGNPGCSRMMAQNRLVVRNARKADALGVQHVEQLLDGERWDARRHRRFADAPPNCTSVAVVGAHVYAFACVTVGRREVLVERLAVLPVARRQGVGAFLLACVESSFLKDRRSVMQAVVGERDLDDQLFLRAVGWRCVKTLVPVRDEGDYYLFEKKAEK
jgi:GNAT superfamily N-acetyltransferase